MIDESSLDEMADPIPDIWDVVEWRLLGMTWLPSGGTPRSKSGENLSLLSFSGDAMISSFSLPFPLLQLLLLLLSSTLCLVPGRSKLSPRGARTFEMLCPLLLRRLDGPGTET